MSEPFTLPPIPDKRYMGIREAAELCGVAPHVLRYWESQFPQLQPRRRAGNRRRYRPADVRCARRIRYLLYDCQYTIAGARQHLAEGGDGPEPTAALREVRGELADLLAQLEAG